MRRVLLAAATLLIFATATAPAAHAHASLVEASPGYDEVFPESPGTASLTFDSTVESALAHIVITDADKAEIARLRPTTPAGQATTVEFALPQLTDGAYLMEWSVYSFDGHVMRGAIPFTVGAAAAAPSSTTPTSASAPPGEKPPGTVVDAPERTTSPVIPLVFGLLVLAALIAAAGFVAFVTRNGQTGSAEPILTEESAPAPTVEAAPEAAPPARPQRRREPITARPDPAATPRRRAPLQARPPQD